MAPADRTWTIHWNEKAAQFVARYRRFPPPIRVRRIGMGDKADSERTPRHSNCSMPSAS